MLILTRKELCLGIYFVFDENKVIAVSEHGQIHQNLGACPKRDESSENKMIIVFLEKLRTCSWGALSTFERRLEEEKKEPGKGGKIMP